MSRRPSRSPSPTPAPDRAGDPLRLCVYTTVALLAWVVGPLVVAGFAGLGVAGYVRARRRGLRSSQCILRDTRLVLAYLGLVGVVAAAAVARQVSGLLG